MQAINYIKQEREVAQRMSERTTGVVSEVYKDKVRFCDEILGMLNA